MSRPNHYIFTPDQSNIRPTVRILPGPSLKRRVVQQTGSLLVRHLIHLQTSLTSENPVKWNEIPVHWKIYSKMIYIYMM